MSDEPTRSQRMAWNNDGMDPDWRPSDPPPRDPNKQCMECGTRLVKALMERERGWFTLAKDLPTEFPNPNVTMPKQRLIEFHNDYGFMADFAARVTGTTVETLNQAAMLGKLMRMDKEATRMSELERDLKTAQARVNVLEDCIKEIAEGPCCPDAKYPGCKACAAVDLIAHGALARAGGESK